MRLNLRLCTNLDVDVLTKISRDTFRAAFEKDNDPNDFKDYMDFAFSKEKLLSELKNPNSSFSFVFDAETLVGYFKVNEKEAQTDINDRGSFELERIYVVQSYQGKQIGGWMLDNIVELAKKGAKAYIWLGVWERNIRAIKFYRKRGFKQFGTHPYFIGNDKQTDWLLRLDL